MAKVHVHGAGIAGLTGVRGQIVGISYNGKASAADAGGRNLLLKSGVKITSANYEIVRYRFGNELPVKGELYTCTIKGSLGSDRIAFGLYNWDGEVANGFGNAEYVAPGLYRVIGYWNHTASVQSTASQLIVYNLLQSGSQPSTIEWIKLERGIVATGWSPAPEDAESRLAAIEAKLGISYEPPIIEGPDYVEELPMDENLLMGGYSELYVVSLLPALVGGARHG